MGGRWHGVSGQDPSQVRQISPATAPSPSGIPPALPSFTNSHPRLRQHRFGFVQLGARRWTARRRARPDRARWDDLWGPLDLKTTKNARACASVVCIVSVSESQKSGLVRDSDESSTSVPPFHTIYTIGTQKTERGGHQGHPEARKSKAVLRRICLVVCRPVHRRSP